MPEVTVIVEREGATGLAATPASTVTGNGGPPRTSTSKVRHLVQPATPSHMRWPEPEPYRGLG